MNIFYITKSTTFSPTKIEELTAGSDENILKTTAKTAVVRPDFEAGLNPSWGGGGGATLCFPSDSAAAASYSTFVGEKGKGLVGFLAGLRCAFCLIQRSALLSLSGKGRVCLRMIRTSASFLSFYNLRKNYPLSCQPHSRFLHFFSTLWKCWVQNTWAILQSSTAWFGGT